MHFDAITTTLAKTTETFVVVYLLIILVLYIMLIGEKSNYDSFWEEEAIIGRSITISNSSSSRQV